MAHVAAARGGSETGLWGGGAGAPERVEDGAIEAPREVAGLVEAALQAPPGVKRHRDQDVGVPEQVGTGRAIISASGAASERRPSYLNAWMILRSAPS